MQPCRTARLQFIAASVFLAPAVFANARAADVDVSKLPPPAARTVVLVADRRDWWSFKPLVRPDVPGGSAQFSVLSAQSKAAEERSTPDAKPLSTEHWALSTWEKPSNPIDAFILAKLREHNLTPSPEAGRRTLIRRLYFDLTGLPPTPEEVEAFAADNDTHAYEKLVDRLLASPRYGERWARHWLDVVHYGDTHGYDKDKPRPNAWPYRDYVIRAFNEDKPYARFVQEQIAGDALFPDTRDGIEALGFIAAGPWDYIGHAEVPETKIDGKVARHLDRDDMVTNTIQTFNSLTVQCAQCHNHKFDPIAQEDYYALQAVFAALDRTERKYYRDDQLNRRFGELQRKQAALNAEILAVEEPLKRQAGASLAALARRIEGASTQAAKKQGNTSPDFGWHSAVSETQDATKWVQVDLGRRVTIGRVTLLPCYDDFNSIGAGFGFPVRFKVEASDDPEFKTGVTLFWKRHDQTFMADFPNPGLQPFTTSGTRDDGIEGRYVRVTAVKLAPRKNDFIFALAELQVFDESGKNIALGRSVTALDSIEAPPRWRKTNLTDGIAPVAQSPDEKEKLLAERETLLLSFADEATKAKRAALLEELQRVSAEVKKLPTPDAVYAGGIHTGSGAFAGTGANGGKPRPIFLLKRGNVQTPDNDRGEIVPGALNAIAALPGHFDLPPAHTEGERRAALAKWLTDPRNPLTWRSIVNRVWEYHFGRGIVDTPNDFGHMGQQPTHPELLDWLACEFRDGGQSMKKLHRLIVTSATYRQGSGESAQFSVLSAQSEIANAGAAATEHWPLSTEHFRRAGELDAENKLLWHAPRRRLEAEAIRDSVVFISGQLDERMFGPGFQDFVIEHPEHSPHYEYHLHDPDDPKSHRRSIYRFIVRSQMQPFMTTLDCADPSMQVDKRNQSLSALQALALLNNSLMVTMSKHFAEKLDNTGGDLAARVERAYFEAIGHAPSPQDKSALTAYAQQHGLANLCRVIFNLNEFVFVD
jgi:uncharacterized protein DUF1549/uncharacterized protein DUF1553